MYLPNPDRAVVPMRKLTNYALTRTHERGRHQAILFESILGLTTDDADVWAAALMTAIRTHEAVYQFADQHGATYRVEFAMTTEKGTATIRSNWIVRHGENFPRLTTCYVHR